MLAALSNCQLNLHPLSPDYSTLKLELFEFLIQISSSSEDFDFFLLNVFLIKISARYKNMQGFGLRQSLRLFKRTLNYASRRGVSTDEKLVDIRDESGVKKITLNSPKTRNSLSMKMMEELMDGITAASDPSTRCVVISAVGPVFSSGHNLKELEKGTPDFYTDTFKKCADLMISIIKAPVPVIACVNGIAAAAGCQLVASCDIVIATNQSSFSTPGANVGIFCSTPGIALSRSVNNKAAARMLLTGLSVSAEEALQIGLISRMCSENELEKEVEEHVNAIKSKSRAVIALGKKFFYSHLQKDIHTAYELGVKVMTDNLLMEDGQEGLQSFVQKRKPSWKQNY